MRGPSERRGPGGSYSIVLPPEMCSTPEGIGAATTPFGRRLAVQSQVLNARRHRSGEDSLTGRPQRKQGVARWKSKRRRTDGSVAGRCRISLRRRFIFAQPFVLEKGEADHREHRVVVQSTPRATLEVVQPQFFFELLVDLFAGPARLDRGGQVAQRRVDGVVGKVILALVGALLANKPHLRAW